MRRLLASAAVPAASLPGKGVWLAVRKAPHSKCVRCWHRVVDVGQNAQHPELCLRCVGNISGDGEQRSCV